MKLIFAHKDKPNHTECMYINPAHIMYMHECYSDKTGEPMAKTIIKLSDGSLIENIISWEEVDFKQRGKKGD